MPTQWDAMAAMLPTVAAVGGEQAWNALSPDQRMAALRQRGVTDPQTLAMARSVKGGRDGFFETLGTKIVPAVGAAFAGPALLGALGGTGAVSGAGAVGGPGGLGSLLGGKVNLGTLAKLGLAGLGTLTAARQQGRGNAIVQQMAQQQAAQAADAAKLRGQFMQRVGNLPTHARDLGSLFQTSNPFARQPLATVQGPAPSVTPLAMQGQPLAMPALSPLEAQLQRLRRGSGPPSPRLQQL